MLEFSSKIFIKLSLNGTLIAGLSSCAGRSDSSWDPILKGTIDYPFGERSEPLGVNGPEDKFILRSQIGNTEYTVEIPKAGRDYDIEVPMEDLQPGSSPNGRNWKKPSEGNAAATDRELEKAMPHLAGQEDQRLVESALGVAEVGGPSQSPSYSIGIAKINEYYLDRKFEFCLIEINQLLSFYPASAKLYKMKGTILLKMQSIELAEIAWSRALELSPDDRSLDRALEKLRRRIEAKAKIVEAKEKSVLTFDAPEKNENASSSPESSQPSKSLTTPPQNVKESEEDGSSNQPALVDSSKSKTSNAANNLPSSEIPKESLEGIKPSAERDLPNVDKNTNKASNDRFNDFYY